jgi:hypothetical protein
VTEEFGQNTDHDDGSSDNNINSDGYHIVIPYSPKNEKQSSNGSTTRINPSDVTGKNNKQSGENITIGEEKVCTIFNKNIK